MYDEYPIDIVLVLNLKSRPDRLWSVFGALTVAGVPLNIIKRWDAIPGSNYESFSEIANDAVKDRFPEFEQIFEIEDERSENNLAKDITDQLAINILTQRWSYCQMLRYLIDNQLSGLILYDDRFIKNWDIISTTYNILRLAQPNNKKLILQLDYYNASSCNQDGFLNPVPYNQGNYVYYILEGPITSSENAMLYSPEGAEFMLNELLTHRIAHGVEASINRLSFLPREERSDYWSVHPDFQIVSYLPALGSDIFGDSSYINFDIF